MKKIVFSVMCVCATMMLSSCYVQEVNVGMNESEQAIQIAKVKNQQLSVVLLIRHKTSRLDPRNSRSQRATAQHGQVRSPRVRHLPRR